MTGESTTAIGKLFIISAPSGTGKTTLVNALLENIGALCSIERVVTYTTKTPRVTEEPGKDYHFIGRTEFEALIQKSFFLEWSSFYDYYYGTPFSIIYEMSLGKSFIVVIDRVGARQIVGRVPGAITIWIYPPCFKTLERRLHNRGTETLEQIERRLACARIEMTEEKSENLYKHHIKNDEFAAALISLRNIFLKELAAESSIMKNEIDVA